MPFPALNDLRGPLLLERIYPVPMNAFAEVERARSRDIVVPDMARSPQNIRVQEIDQRFGDLPFHFDLIAVPRGMTFTIPNPATVGFVTEFEVPLYRLFGLFCQDDVDLQRGWLENTRSIRSRFENHE